MNDLMFILYTIDEVMVKKLFEKFPFNNQMLQQLNVELQIAKNGCKISLFLQRFNRR